MSHIRAALCTFVLIAFGFLLRDHWIIFPAIHFGPGLMESFLINKLFLSMYTRILRRRLRENVYRRLHNFN